MATHLSDRGAFETRSIVMRDDHLVVMRNRGGADQLRRIKFAHMRQIAFERTTRWFTVIVCLLLVSLGFLIGTTFSVIAASTIAIPAGAALAWVLYHGRTRIIVLRENGTDTIGTTSPRGRVERFRSRLDAAVRECHRRGWAEWDEKASASPE